MDTTYPPLFISYKSEDRALAQDLYGRLTAAGFDVWFDAIELDRAVSWFGLIEKASDAARIVLPVLTPNWPSKWTEYETYPGECVVPLVFEGEGRLDECVPAPIAEWQALDLRGATDETWQQEQAMARLLQCREILRGMRDRGMYLDPPAAAVLEQLDQLPQAHGASGIG